MTARMEASGREVPLKEHAINRCRDPGYGWDVDPTEMRIEFVQQKGEPFAPTTSTTH